MPIIGAIGSFLPFRAVVSGSTPAPKPPTRALSPPGPQPYSTCAVPGLLAGVVAAAAGLFSLIVVVQGGVAPHQS